MSFSIKLHGEERVLERLRRVHRAMETAPEHAARGAGELVEDALRLGAPVRTGRLRAGLRMRVESRGSRATARFTSDAEYTPFVVRGTAPHDIWAGFYTGRSMERALHFGSVFVEHVRHPGTRPDDFPKRAMRDAGTLVRWRLRELAAEIVRGRL